MRRTYQNQIEPKKAFEYLLVHLATPRLYSTLKRNVISVLIRFAATLHKYRDRQTDNSPPDKLKII